MSKTQLRDTGGERALLGTILKNGKDALIDADAIVDSTDFSLPINRAIYLSMKSLSEENCDRFDLESIKLKIRALGFGDLLNSTKDIEYLELLDSSNFAKDNIPLFAMQIKKYAVVRDLYDRYQSATKYLEGITGQEPLSEIINNAEGTIVDFTSGITPNTIEQLTKNIDEYIEEVLTKEEIDQVGIPTGFPIWDDAIGGGPRRGTIAVIGSRSKVGKSNLALNQSINIASRGIPVLYLDSELTKVLQQARMICMKSGCPIYAFETGKFRHNPEIVKNVKDASQVLNTMPLYYESISGMDISEVLQIVRRWLVRHVGFNAQGKANDCVIIYDYLKLTTGEELTKHTPEYIVLGLAITSMHDFAVKYDVPFITYVQLNREGIEGDDTSIIAGSDRILWLCSSMTILRNKDENDISLGCGFEHGNKKLRVLETRHGSGLEVDCDYINLKCSLRPGVSKLEACGSIREGLKYSDVCSGPRNIPKVPNEANKG